MEVLVTSNKIRFTRRTSRQHGEYIDFTAKHGHSEGFGQGATNFTGHCQRDFNMYRYPGLFVGLPPQYLLVANFPWRSWEGLTGVDWANDRTSCDKMMSTERHVFFVYDEPNTGSDREKFARFDSVGRN